MKKIAFTILIIFILITLLLGCTQESVDNNINQTQNVIDNNENNQEDEINDDKNNEIGISEAITMTDSIRNNCVGFLVGDTMESDTINTIGGAWARPHPGPFSWGTIEKSKDNFDFENTDYWVSEMQKDNITILPTVWPFADWDQETCREKECEMTREAIFYPDNFKPEHGVPKWRCAPCNYDDYKSFLSKLVERYDGDGTNDMPGLIVPIQYYEISNEPSMQNDFLTFFKGSPEEYVQILKNSNEAIKEACPDCFVVQGGAAGTSTEMKAFWEEVFDKGGANYFDVANIHFVNYGDIGTLNVFEFKQLLTTRGIEKPIWVTEVEFDDETKIVSSLKGALNAGASKVFFTRFLFMKNFDGPKTFGDYSKEYEGITENCP